MAKHSNIEWTDATWNTVAGCDKVSPGCDHCYATKQSCRMDGAARAELARGENPGRKMHHLDVVTGGDWNGTIHLIPESLVDPLQWSTPQKIFVNSLSDLFHKKVPTAYIREVAQVMEQANWHTYQLLTKRSSRLRNLLRGTLRFAAKQPHIWWGVSVEDRAHGLPRIEHLRQAPAQVRFLSIEPLLEDLGTINLKGIHWVIVGGESGSGARPMRKDWVLSIRDQCEQARIPFFFKQWGGVHKNAAGRELDGRTYDAMPDIVRSPVASRAQRRAWMAALSVENIRERITSL
jgi:protein gp37